MNPDQPCTAEDRDKIVTAAQKRAFGIYLLADVLESYAVAFHVPDAGMRKAMIDAAGELRKLIEP